MSEARVPWPADGGPLDFEQIARPVLHAIRFAYDLQRKNKRRSIPWRGPEIARRDQACCPKITERLQAGNLEITKSRSRSARSRNRTSPTSAAPPTSASARRIGAWSRSRHLLHARHVLDEAQFKALFHYRHHAILADRSPLKDSLNKSPGGGDGSCSIEILNACRVRDDCERAAGSLADILRAVVIDDLSLSQWAMHQGGAIERHETRKGKTVSYLRPRGKFLAIAQLEIVMAAIRVKNALDAGNLSVRPFVRPVAMAA
jgi:hypothetical protein